jgi:hypothetical protein
MQKTLIPSSQTSGRLVPLIIMVQALIMMILAHGSTGTINASAEPAAEALDVEMDAFNFDEPGTGNFGCRKQQQTIKKRYAKFEPHLYIEYCNIFMVVAKFCSHLAEVCDILFIPGSHRPLRDARRTFGRKSTVTR